MVAKSEQASLWTLYLTAYRLYQREVIEQKKLYKRFKDDFINGNTYPKRCDVDGLNEHNKNLGILDRSWLHHNKRGPAHKTLDIGQ